MDLRRITESMGAHIGITSQGLERNQLVVHPLYQQKLPKGMRQGSLIAIGEPHKALFDRLVIARVSLFMTRPVGNSGKIRIAITEIQGLWFGDYCDAENIFMPVEKLKSTPYGIINTTAYWLTGDSRKIFEKSVEYTPGQVIRSIKKKEIK